MANTAAQKVTVNVGGVPYTATSAAKANALAAKGGQKSAGTSSAPPSRGQAGWIDPIRAAGDTTFSDKYGTPTAAEISDANSPDIATSSAPNVPDTSNQATTASTTPASAGTSTAPANQGGNTVGTQSGQAGQAGQAGQNGTPGPQPNVSTTAAAATPIQNKYAAGMANAQASGTPPPQDPGAARSMAASYMPPDKVDTTNADAYLSQDPAINKLMSGITDLLNPQKQASTLMQDYTKFRKDSGLDKINQEMIDADTVINGTEDDIRNEIQTAGGLGTESQVQAMTLARNKSLLTRYNQLSQMKTDATNQLNTMMSLDQQDKQIAQEKINNQVSAMFNMANFRQTALNNTRQQYQWLSEQQGADGLYNSLAKDPRQLGFAEKILGLSPGGLQTVAAQAAKTRAQKEKMDNLDIAAKQAAINASNRAQTEVVDVNGRKFLINSQTGKTISEVNPQGTNTSSSSLAAAQANIQTINDLLKVPYTANAAGTNSLARINLKNPFTGAKTNFIAGVQQVQQQLTLDALQNAKKNGATFGALSEGELNLLNQSASKLGTWAVKDKAGNVVGYNTTPADLQAELTKINNFAKLDYLNKGGSPADVGVVVQPDGTHWTKNPDGSYTKLN